MRTQKPLLRIVVLSLVVLALSGCTPTETPAPMPTNTPTPGLPSIEILLDDFSPQPYQGQSVFFFNRLEGDRGAINESTLRWGDGQVTTAIGQGKEWGGAWMSLNHPIREGLPIDFSAILPVPILSEYQSRITSATVRIADGTPGRTFKLELKNGNDTNWQQEVTLEGGEQVLEFDLPALGNIDHLVWVLDHARPDDYIVLDSVSFTATKQITDTAMAAFVWSYGMLLNNWNPDTGLVRDKARDASGEFDAIQTTGSLAAATAIAEQLGVVERGPAIQIVDKIGETLLRDLPRLHGLWPHWVKTSPEGALEIVENTEWSSVDTVIAAIALLTAQSALGMDTSDTERVLQEIEWENLITPTGISHGYYYSGDPIPHQWDAFGGESWLVELAYAAATGQVAPLAYPSPPTANGSGFIDELAFLFVPPPTGPDFWGTDWNTYRKTAADSQISYYSTLYPSSCFTQLGLFGLSAAEVPEPSRVAQDQIYQAYGIGGAFVPVNDGSALLGAPVVVPHYSALIASLHPEEAIKMWDWLITQGGFSPLTNVESVMFPEDVDCDPSNMIWNQLKGSWNLTLQVLGWGRYLAERDNRIPALWRAVSDAESMLGRGYGIVASEDENSTPIAEAWHYERECEHPDEATVGQTIERSNASGLKVHGQFGTKPAWPPQPGYVQFDNIRITQTEDLILVLRYSKYSSSSVPIFVSLDDESTPRATFIPVDQGSWDNFTWTEPISLGHAGSGLHSIRFSTDGQEFGVADLDVFILADDIASLTPTSMETPSADPTMTERPTAEPMVTLTHTVTATLCSGVPPDRWAIPGTYQYKDGVGEVLTSQVPLTCYGREPYLGPGAGLREERRLPTTKMVLPTDLGMLEVARVEIIRTISGVTSRGDWDETTSRTVEFYACGYGLVRCTLTGSTVRNRMPGSERGFQYQLELVSFTPALR
jgi:hypothetical protein